MAAAHGHSFEGVVLDVVHRPRPPRPVARSSPEEKAELHRIRIQRAELAARDKT